MYDNAHMDTTIRNLDEATFRALKARAALTGQTIGETVNEAMRAYLASPGVHQRTASLRDLGTRPYPQGNERLSENLDAVVYGSSEPVR